MKKTIRFEFTTVFEGQRRKAPHEVRKIFLENLALFLEDTEHNSLRNHPLRGKLTGYRSIDVTSDYRAVFKQKISKRQTIITFHLFGAHKQLYGK